MKIAKFGFSLFGINTYVVRDPETKDAVIIDPGMSHSEEYEAMKGFVEREHLHVTQIINTHMHIDHAIGNCWAVKEYGVPVAAHRADEQLGGNLKQQAIMFGLTDNVDEVKIDVFLEDGDEIPVGNGKLQVIHVPGHSPGGIVLYDKADKFAIVGDAIFEGSIGRTDLPGGDYQTLIDAIRSKILSLPDDTTLFPGHGPATTVGAEKHSNPFLR